MKLSESEQKTRWRDTSADAISARLYAALSAIEKSQRDVAQRLGKKTQTLNSQFKKGAPSIDLLDYFYVEHDIDANFILFGDTSQIEPETRAKILTALSLATTS